VAETFVAVNQATAPGAKVKTFESTDGGGDVVESQAVVLVDEIGEVLGSAANPVRVDAIAAVIDTAELTNINASISSVRLLAANVGRRGAVIVNDSQSATLYLKYGPTASLTSFTYYLGPGQTWEMPAAITYTGIIDGVWSIASGTARVTELA
jgi:hypothetical protein